MANTAFLAGWVEHRYLLYARITSVADSFDALIRDRSYRKAWGFEKAVEYISRNSGLRFDPEVVEAFLSML